MDNTIECGGFVFVHNFDSGNLGHVKQIPKIEIVPGINSITNAPETPDYEFNIWTRPDCAGTEFENGNRTWFYFGIQKAPPHALVKLNMVNLNRQGKMYSQGMAPVTKTVPGRSIWERIKDRPTYVSSENVFTLSFKYRTPENTAATSYFAFTYPYTYMELQNALSAIDLKLLSSGTGCDDDIYYCRECICYSLERRRMDLLTITSRHGITNVREDRLQNLFPDQFCPRPFKFANKKVIFVSARVHPGETPSSFVFNGFLHLLMSRHDPVALVLRRMYVFKLVPFLNPDGVARGHYRTDTRGVNLNRVYLSPSLQDHPTVFAARALIRYYHFGYEKEDVYETSENSLLVSTFDSDCNSSQDLILNKDFDNPDQENLKSFPLNIKRKKVNGPKDGNRRWSSIHAGHPPNSSRPPLQSKPASPNTSGGEGLRRNKLKVDSEDDTTSSVIMRPTLADQVEDLNLNTQSMDGFNRSAMDDECAVDHIIKPPLPLSRAPIQIPSKLSTTVELTTDDDDDDDSASCGAKPFFTNSDSFNSKSSWNEKASYLSMSEMLKFSQWWCLSCRRTINGLEARMPGISSMTPSRYKTQESSSSGVQEEELPKCINCHCPLLSGEKLAVSPIPALHDVQLKSNMLSANNLPATFAFAAQASASPFSGSSTRDINKNCIDSSKMKSGTKKGSKGAGPSVVASGSGCGNGGGGTNSGEESGLFLYLDLHGHASKKGIFMYGNHFTQPDASVDCMLLPRIMSLNNMHFHFTSCNFTERNMYLRDRRDGMSREGSGRVAVLKATGLTRSYTLECNYNTGRIINTLPPAVRDLALSSSSVVPLSPPKYTPQLFEEVGKSLGASILDLTAQNPNSRVPNSEHRNLHGVREWLRAYHKQHSPSQVNNNRAASAPRTPRPSSRRRDPERKENLHSDLPAIRSGSSSRLHSAKFLSVRSKSHSDQPFSSKNQRNLSLISIKKPTVAKHSAVFKAPLSKSPSRRIRLGIKSKHPDEGESTKGSVRSLLDSNKINKQRIYETKVLKSEYKQKDVQKQKLDALGAKKSKLNRNKEGSYQKQPAQFATKRITKRLKISQFIKYTDNSKEKYRVRKGTGSKSGGPLSPGVASSHWEAGADLGKLTANKFL